MSAATREDAVPPAALLEGPDGAVVLGARFEVALSAPAAAGGTLRLYGAFALDPAFVLERSVSEPASGDGAAARLRLELRACGSGALALGPFHVALHEPGRGERTLTTAALPVEVAQPWQGEPSAPFVSWRLAAPWPAATGPRSLAAPVGAGAALLALLLAAWVAVRRRRARPAVVAAAIDPRDRALLRARWPDERAARRRHCFALHGWLRAELAERAPATAWAWVARELLARPDALAFAAERRRELGALLTELECAMYSATGVDAASPDLGARLAALLPERAP